jgi:hypothetical protein
MVKRTAVLLSLIIFSLLPIAVINTLASSQEPPQPAAQDSVPPSGTGIAANRHEHALINSDYLMVYGPDICTRWGDPFSPITPTWAGTSWLNPLDFQGIYTYHFRIRIPADYPDEVVRVELFDPDSINQAGTYDDIIYSSVAHNIDPAQFPLGEIQKYCSGVTANQRNACAISTGEETLVGSNGITIDHINPFWFIRVDENRGDGTPGVCANTNEYSPTLNTQTRYTLSYFAPTGNGDSEQVVLASYLGQTGDGIRDNGDHDTDLRWVSPGAQPSFDHAFVPAEQGDFEIDLAQDIPDLTVDPVTGDRFLYLDITSLSGASRNAFAIWAGPDDYVNIPSNVNERNLYVLSNPGAYDGRGVKVEAIDFLPRETISTNPVKRPLVELGPEYAGQTITVTMFDPDAGTKPPIAFFMDTLAFTPDDTEPNGIDESLTDWGVSFGGDIDPLGRCFDGGSAYNDDCQNMWIDPVYTITIPSEQQCDYANPTPETCTPFYGGQLWTRFKGGRGDGQVWHVDVPERPLFDNTQSCTAFPIGVYENIRSLTPATWRTDLDYPNPAPAYDSFVNNVPDVSLQDAREGYIYNISSRNPTGGLGWLVWNQCIGDSSTTLADSLAWPGNSNDYTPLGGTCIVNGETMNTFAGFMEVGDNSDKNMNIDDWVGVSTANANNNSVRDALEEHVDLDRILRVVVYDDYRTGIDTSYLIRRFALMRLIGFSLDQTGGDSFIIAEFIGWDFSCSQVATPLDTITLDGPANGLINTNHTFTATISPINVTPPITIVWSATDSAPFTQTNKLEANHTFQWSTPGTKTITVTAGSEHGDPVTDTTTITIEQPPIPLTSVAIQPDPEIVGNVVTVTAVSTPTNATQPISYTWEANGETIIHSNGLTDTASFTLPYASTQTITVTASNEVGDPITDTIEVTVEPLRTFLPIVMAPPCETHTAVLNLDIEPTAVSVNDTLTVTATLENSGCANIGLPQYRLTASPELVDPAAPDPITHSLGLGPGDSDSAEFVVTAVSPGTLTLNSTVSFEVHLGYPGPAYWGAAGTSKEITITP